MAWTGGGQRAPCTVRRRRRAAIVSHSVRRDVLYVPTLFCSSFTYHWSLILQRAPTICPPPQRMRSSPARSRPPSTRPHPLNLPAPVSYHGAPPPYSLHCVPPHALGETIWVCTVIARLRTGAGARAGGVVFAQYRVLQPTSVYSLRRSQYSVPQAHRPRNSSIKSRNTFSIQRHARVSIAWLPLRPSYST